jgi:DNA-binding MarR family transcriptional regulator
MQSSLPAMPAAEETRHILEALSTLTRRLARATGGAEEGPPMTSTQRLALFETASEGPLRLSELADRMGITAPTASRAVEGLVELGLLQRLPDPADRRAVRIDLTPTGRGQVEERKARAAAAIEPAVAALAPRDRSRLATLLARMSEEIEGSSRRDA